MNINELTNEDLDTILEALSNEKTRTLEYEKYTPIIRKILTYKIRTEKMPTMRKVL
jgi:hypothetical protein